MQPFRVQLFPVLTAHNCPYSLGALMPYPLPPAFLLTHLHHAFLLMDAPATRTFPQRVLPCCSVHIFSLTCSFSLVCYKLQGSEALCVQPYTQQECKDHLINKKGNALKEMWQ